MSSSNEGVYPVTVTEAIGKSINDFRPNTHLPRILETGKAEIGRSMIVQRKNRIIARIPLVKEVERVGARNPKRINFRVISATNRNL
jgi:sensor histidine kinase regulating citrate/malate metabolism